MKDLDCLPALPDDEDLVPSPIVKKENGGISDMTLWRWTRDPRIQFPQPDIVINGRKYWKRRTLRRHRRRLEVQQSASRVDQKAKVMAASRKLMLPFAHWPIQDRRRWDAAFQSGDLFDQSGPGACLAAATRQLRLESYGRFLGFLSAKHPKHLNRPPEARLDRRILIEYVAWRRKSCGDISLAADLRSLRGTLKLICQDTNWSWLQSIANRIAAAAPRPARKYNLVTSDRLYAIGVELMDFAVTAADARGRTGTRQAIQYRDGLIISTLAMIPLRRGTLAALQVGRHLVRVGDHWELDVPAPITKTRRALDYSIPRDLSARIDLYLERFRSRIRGSDKHAGLWPSHHSIQMRPDSINVAVQKRTRKALGFGVNLHRFRHAAATFWSIHDPVNVRGAKDLLGQATFATTEKYYIMAQSRLAGRALARTIDDLKSSGASH